jgi:Na+-translocating ferredoxin:NAD+ oxidoreductase RnfD subunit
MAGKGMAITPRCFSKTRAVEFVDFFKQQSPACTHWNNYNLLILLASSRLCCTKKWNWIFMQNFLVVKNRQHTRHTIPVSMGKVKRECLSSNF